MHGGAWTELVFLAFFAVYKPWIILSSFGNNAHIIAVNNIESNMFYWLVWQVCPFVW